MTESRDRFFSFPHPINSYVARWVAGGVVLMAVAAIALDQPWIMPVLAYGLFIARVLAGPRLSPLALFVTKLLQPAIGNPTKFVPGPPKRFAASIGVVFSVTATVLHFGFGLTGPAYGVLGALVFAAALEAVFGLCLGCLVFNLMMRVGLLPESVCQDCADFSRRQARLEAGGQGPSKVRRRAKQAPPLRSARALRPRCRSHDLMK
ncbi:MAG: DUF4395 domain-containing protein [Chloroflexi bacterium]|nr:DUF4395 domain-containing protein [Chloroflexota bacterium]